MAYPQQPPAYAGNLPCLAGENAAAESAGLPGVRGGSQFRLEADAYDGGPDIEEQEFDYDEFVKKEFGPERSPVNPLWWITGVVLLLAFAAWIVVEAVR